MSAIVSAPYNTFAQIARELVSATRTNDTTRITALAQTLADVVVSTAVANTHYLRDGELVVFGRPRSQWQHCEWHAADGVRYMRIYVNGKTGARHLIGKHELANVLQRLHSRQQDICKVEFDAVLGRESAYVFRTDNSLPIRFFNDTFDKLLR